MEVTWHNIKNQIKSELSKNSFSLWINPITFLEKTDNTVVLGCPNKFSLKWVTENYLKLIRDKLHEAQSDHLDVTFKVQVPRRINPPSHTMPQPEQLPLPNIPGNGRPKRLRLNKDFVFDRFVVGRSNEFAYSASKAMAYGQTLNYNTLLMLANTGLGKTHLSQAIGHTIVQQNPETRVYYITAEDFTNQMISSLKNNRIEEFKNRYRRYCDVLLLEEIHFLSGKEKTQTELGYTLDALANDDKKIIFTSSLPPKDIPRMSKELSSRLTSGLITTIDKPDYDTRVKIFTNKSSELNLPISEEIIHFLAGHLKPDIRQMESALNCLKAQSELLNEKINLDLAKNVVDSLVSTEHSITSRDIKNLVAKYYKIDPDVLHSKSRKKVHAYPRNIYVYLCRKHTDETLENIAATINRSHSTVLYASELVEHKIKTNAGMMSEIRFLSQNLESVEK